MFARPPTPPDGGFSNVRDSVMAGRRAAAAALCLLAVSCAGCSGGSPTLTAADEAKMRSNMERHGPVNLNDLPADQRQKIQAFMQQRQGLMPGQSPGKAAAPAGR